MISLLPRKMKSLNKTFTLVSAGFETCQDRQRRLLFEEKMENEINKAFLIKTRPSEGSRAISLLRRRKLKMYRQNQKEEQISFVLICKVLNKKPRFTFVKWRFKTAVSSSF